jgi:hypothetical protein
LILPISQTDFVVRRMQKGYVLKQHSENLGDLTCLIFSNQFLLNAHPGTDLQYNLHRP